jgi:hypothetical protein
MKFEFDKDVSKDTFASLSGNQERQTCFQIGQEILLEVQSSGLFSGGSQYLHSPHTPQR